MVSETMFDRVLALNREAVAAGQFEVAYHLLAAALEWAHAMRDLDRVLQVAAIAKQQGDIVDADPNHPLSTGSANVRGTIPLYRSLTSTAQGIRAGINAERVIEQHRHERLRRTWR
jgi:hypothetical protein